MVNFSQTEYVKSVFFKRDLIDDDLPQFAFIGRSNVGKSSLINALTERKKLALTSKQPGKTRTINFFFTDHQFYLVDLPGYGFAKSRETYQLQWNSLIEFYLLEIRSLKVTFLLWDAEVSPKENDLQVLKWYRNHRLPYQIILTKADRLSQSHCLQRVDEILSRWNEAPILFSSSKKRGIEDLRSLIVQCVPQEV